MMKLNNEEWTAIADAIAGAHMLNQAVYALLKQRKADLNRDQRQLLTAVPELVRTAFQLLGKIDRRERGEPDEPTNTPTSDISKLDIRVLRNELENVSALNLPELTYEMACVLEELPMYAEYSKKDNHERIVAARAFAWAWEAGRRYGVSQAAAVFSGTIIEYANNTNGILDQVLDLALELPQPEPNAEALKLVEPLPPTEHLLADAEQEAFDRAMEKPKRDRRFKVIN